MGIFDILKPTKGNQKQEEPKAPSVQEETTATETIKVSVAVEQPNQPTTIEPELTIEVEENPVIEISVPETSEDSIRIETPKTPGGLQRRIKKDTEKAETPIIQIETPKAEEPIEIKQSTTETHQVSTASVFVPTLEMGDATTIRLKIKERIVKEATIGTDLDRTLIWTNNIQIHSSLNNGDFVEKLKADYGDKCCYSLNEGEVIIRKGSPNEKDNATEIFAGVWFAFSKGIVIVKEETPEDPIKARITIWQGRGEMLQDEYILEPGKTDGNVYFIGCEDPTKTRRQNHIVIPSKYMNSCVSREQADIIIQNGKFILRALHFNNSASRTKITRFNAKGIQEDIRFLNDNDNNKVLKDKDIIHLAQSIQLRFELIYPEK